MTHDRVSTRVPRRAGRDGRADPDGRVVRAGEETEEEGEQEEEEEEEDQREPRIHQRRCYTPSRPMSPPDQSVQALLFTHGRAPLKDRRSMGLTGAPWA